MKNLLKKNLRYSLSFFVFIFFEIKNFKKIFFYFFGYIKQEVDIFKFISEKKSNKIFKNKYLIQFLERNKNFFIKNKEVNNQKKIIVECLINHPIYTISQSIIATILGKNFNYEIVAIIRKGDLRTKAILESFGIKKIIVHDDWNIVLRLKSFLKSLSLLNNVDSVNKILKLKYNYIEVGKTIYEHYGRFLGEFPKKFNWTLVKFLSECLLNIDKTNLIIRKYSPTYLVQSEQQFIPHRIIFQTILKKNIKIISRSDVKNCGIKIFSKFSSVNQNRYKLSKKLFDYICKKYKNNVLKESKKLFFNKRKFNIGQEIHQHLQKKIKHKIEIKNEEQFYRTFSFNNKFPTVMILAHNMTDGNFGNSWNIFKNDYEWLIFSLDYLKNKPINILLKRHPSDDFYKSKLNTLEVYNKIRENYKKNTIKLFPEEYDLKKIKNFIDVVITSHGSAGYQYPAFSIPTIICGETSYSNLGFNIEPKNKTDYKKILDNLKSLKKLKNKEQNKAKIFWYLFYKLCKVELPLIYYSNIRMDYDKTLFWRKTLIEQKKMMKDIKIFEKYFNYQIKNNNTNIIKFDYLKNFGNFKF